MKKTYQNLKFINATIADYLVIQNMARFYVYDMSRYCEWECPEDGLFECSDFRKYLEGENKHAFLLKIDEELAGFIFVNKLEVMPEVDWNIGEFFILAKFQNSGIGKQVAKQVFDMFPGEWSVGAIPQNTKALSFWRNVITEYTNSKFFEVEKTSEQLKTAEYPDPYPMTILRFKSPVDKKKVNNAPRADSDSDVYGKLCTEFYDNDKPFATDQEIAFYGQFFRKDQLILEPMCGSGRLLIPMLEAGYKLHGLDNSPYMLANCKERLKQHNLHTEIFEQSVTELNLTQKYDGIIIPFGSFQLLYPRAVAYEALVNLHYHLKPGGKIVFDLFIPWEAMYLDGEEGRSEKSTILPNGSIIVHKSHSKANKFEQYSTSHSTYEKIIDGKVTTKEEDSMHLCWYFLYEFELILEKYGFSNVKRLKKVINDEELIVYIAEKA